jgi:hypothetical protein
MDTLIGWPEETLLAAFRIGHWMIRQFALLSVLLSITIGWPNDRIRADSTGFTPIFDGQSLDGWAPFPNQTKGDWTVRGSAIVGIGSANRLSYLVWKNQDLRNFELRFRYRMLTKGNSGIEIRAKHDTTCKRPFVGYHADFGHIGIGPNVLGAWDFHFAKRKEHPCLRGTSLVITENGSAQASKLKNAIQLKDIKKRDWNDVRIVAKENRFQFFINQKLSSEFTDNAKTGQLNRGAIALQLHDKGMRVEFKDLTLRVFED